VIDEVAPRCSPRHREDRVSTVQGCGSVLHTVRGCRRTRDGMAFWAVSDLNDTELDQFVRALTP
jgi:hypothetical protein